MKFINYNLYTKSETVSSIKHLFSSSFDFGSASNSFFTAYRYLRSACYMFFTAYKHLFSHCFNLGSDSNMSFTAWRMYYRY